MGEGVSPSLSRDGFPVANLLVVSDSGSCEHGFSIYGGSNFTDAIHLNSFYSVISVFPTRKQGAIFVWVQGCSHSSDPRVSCVPGIVLPKSWVLDPSFSSLRTPATGTVGSISFDDEDIGVGDADIAVSEGLSSYQGGSNTDLVRSESRERGDPKKGSYWASIVGESSDEDEKADISFIADTAVPDKVTPAIVGARDITEGRSKVRSAAEKAWNVDVAGSGLSGTDLHVFGLPISDPVRFGDGEYPKSSVTDLSPFRSDSGDVSSVLGLSSGGARVVLLPGLAGDSRVFATTSVAVTGAADLQMFAQPTSVTLHRLKTSFPGIGGGDFPQFRLVSGSVKVCLSICPFRSGQFVGKEWTVLEFR